MTIQALLETLPHWGSKRAQRLLVGVSVSGARLVGDLTSRQRDVILGRYHETVGR